VPWPADCVSACRTRVASLTRAAVRACELCAGSGCAVTASGAGLRVRLVAPHSKYHGAEGLVDAAELELSRRRNTPVAVRLVDADAPGTVAFADELEVMS
jgi:hypothetical protein